MIGGSVREDIEMLFLSRHDFHRIFQSQVRVVRFAAQPDVVQSLGADAASKVSMKLQDVSLTMEQACRRRAKKDMEHSEEIITIPRLSEDVS